MKHKSILLVLLFAAISICSFSQSERFIGAMKKNLSQIDSSFKSPAELLSLSNSFERIAVAEKNEWLPYYYAAFLQVNLGFMEQDKSKVDGIADKASSLIKIADSLNPGNSEISCIKSMIASCHMMVDPMNRWMQYGQESGSNIDAAIKQDPTNPRPYFLRGQGLKYTPEQFGGGCKTAKPVLETALEKYNQFKAASDIAPNWGKLQVEAILKECQ